MTEEMPISAKTQPPSQMSTAVLSSASTMSVRMALRAAEMEIQPWVVARGSPLRLPVSAFFSV